MWLNNIRRLPIVDKGYIESIAPDKDIFKAITNNASLISNIGNQTLIQHNTLFDKFIEYWFSDICKR